MSGSVFPLDGRKMDADERWLLCVDGETLWLVRIDRRAIVARLLQMRLDRRPPITGGPRPGRGR
jgi:hypothetical protein